MSFKRKVAEVATEIATQIGATYSTLRSYQSNGLTFTGGSLQSIAVDGVTCTVLLGDGTTTLAIMGFQQRVLNETVSAIGGVLL